MHWSVVFSFIKRLLEEETGEIKKPVERKDFLRMDRKSKAAQEALADLKSMIWCKSLCPLHPSGEN